MLELGQAIGRYRILAKIGEGGMGHVYRARDPHLQRDVAIKVLPDTWAHDPERLARFRREAQVLASLNHPHIAQVYGVETTAPAEAAPANTTALVMELVDGPTLADRLACGPLPVAEAVAIARQLAQALDTAHEHGIVHRDLKPANVKVREDGTVKLLDFGLAKALGFADGSHQSASTSPTITSPAMTARGQILGTAAYMSPEQARGRAVDKRTDIWAFGCVLFEMLAGRRPFDGEDVTDVLAAIVKSEPAWALLPSTVPPPLVTLLTRCLEKDLTLRLRDIGDAQFDLTNAVRGAPLAPPSRLSRVERTAWAAVVVACAAAATWVWWSTRAVPANNGQLIRFPFVVPEGQRLDAPARRVAVSPDGALIVYAANRLLFRRPLSEVDPQPIAGTNDALLPVFSPDGRSIAFVTIDSIGQTFVVKTVSTAGGTAVKIADLGRGANNGGWSATDFTMAWSGDDIVISDHVGISAISVSTGARRLLIPIDSAAEVATAPQVMDNGRQVLFTLRRVAERGPEASSIVVQSVGRPDRRVVARAASAGVVLPGGRLVYLRGNDLLDVPFDVRSLQVVGDPATIATGVSVHWAVSAGGTIIYQTLASRDPRSLVWLNRQGREEAIAIPPQTASMARLSPDGQRVALTTGNEIRVWSIEKRTITQISEPEGGLWDVVWRADGRALVFSSGASLTSMRILSKSADGGGVATVVDESPEGGFPNALSPDGRFLIFHRGAGELMIQPLAPYGPARPLTNGTALNAVVSPDGHWVAYQSEETGRLEIMVRAFPDTQAGRWQVSSGGGKYPIWSPDGRELYFINSRRMLTAVEVHSDDGFSTGAPIELFSTRGYAVDGNSRQFDISRDGKRFLFLKNSADVRSVINVVTNWPGR